MFFPFDDTLVGYQEVVTLKTSDLPIPIFNFPKGSFFVDGTYAKIKGTNNILRPGIDYLVLSCNEKIPFSVNTAQNEKLKQAYVRNAILLNVTEPLELEWYVAYCGGEETNKASEYSNYINQLFNEARNNGTVNLFTTPHQPWGGFLSSDNTQIMAGKYIYSQPFKMQEELAQGGLGWGKVELAIQAIADSVSCGNDPAIIDAFFNWTKHNEIEYLKAKEKVEADLEAGILNLSDKRVGVDQYIFADSPRLPPTQKFIEHNNVILRGLDPANEEMVGFHGLASFGFDLNASAAKLYQRINNQANDNRIRYGATFETENIQSSTIRYRLLKGIGALNGRFTVYVVSKQLGRVIHSRDVSTEMANANLENALFSFSYPTENQDFSVDTLFVYVLDGNNQGDFGWVGSARYLVKNVSYGYEIAAISRGKLLGPEEKEKVSSQVELVIRRDFALYANTLPLYATSFDGKSIFKINDVNSVSIAFAVGENEKRVLVNLNDAAILDSHSVMLFRLGPINTPVATLLFGLKTTGVQEYAYLKLLDMDSLEVTQPKTETAYVLQVNFSKDADFFNGDLDLKLTKHSNDNTIATLGAKNIVSKGVVQYPIVFSGSAGSLITVEMLHPNNASFKTNQLNLVLTQNTVMRAMRTTSVVELRSRTQWKLSDTDYLLNFHVDVLNANFENAVFGVESELPEIHVPSFIICTDNQLRFQARISKQDLNFTDSKLSLSYNGVVYSIPFSIDLDNLLQVEIEYLDGSLSNKTLDLNRPFRVMLGNPYPNKIVKLKRSSYPLELGLKDLEYGYGMDHIVPEEITLNPHERKQITLGNWVVLNKLSSTNPTLIFSPNLDVVVVDSESGRIDKVGSYLKEVGGMMIHSSDYAYKVINRLTGKAEVKSRVDGVIDILLDFKLAIDNILSVKLRGGDGIFTLANADYNASDKSIVVSINVTPPTEGLTNVNVADLWIDLFDGMANRVYAVNVDMEVVDDEF